MATKGGGAVAARDEVIHVRLGVAELAVLERLRDEWGPMVRLSRSDVIRLALRQAGEKKSRRTS